MVECKCISFAISKCIKICYEDWDIFTNQLSKDRIFKKSGTKLNEKK